MKTPDWGQMLQEILAAPDMNERRVIEQLRIADLSPKLLKHYAEGGQPIYPRGYAICMLWLEATGKTEEQMPWVDWSMSYRSQDAGDMVQKPRCTTCGQVLRGHRGEHWKQLQIHHEQFGDQSKMPAWLSPRVIEHAKVAKAAGKGAKPVRRPRRVKEVV